MSGQNREKWSGRLPASEGAFENSRLTSKMESHKECLLFWKPAAWRAGFRKEGIFFTAAGPFKAPEGGNADVEIDKKLFLISRKRFAAGEGAFSQGFVRSYSQL